MFVLCCFLRSFLLITKGSSKKHLTLGMLLLFSSSVPNLPYLQRFQRDQYIRQIWFIILVKNQWMHNVLNTPPCHVLFIQYYISKCIKILSNLESQLIWSFFFSINKILLGVKQTNVRIYDTYTRAQPMHMSLVIL